MRVTPGEVVRATEVRVDEPAGGEYREDLGPNCRLESIGRDR